MAQDPYPGQAQHVRPSACFSQALHSCDKDEEAGPGGARLSAGRAGSRPGGEGEAGG